LAGCIASCDRACGCCGCIVLLFAFLLPRPPHPPPPPLCVCLNTFPQDYDPDPPPPSSFRQIMAFVGQLKMAELKLRDAETLLADKERDITEVPMGEGGA
jgi:hypothetical protein